MFKELTESKTHQVIEQWLCLEAEIEPKQFLILSPSVRGVKMQMLEGWIESKARTEGAKRLIIEGGARIESKARDWMERGLGRWLGEPFLRY